MNYSASIFRDNDIRGVVNKDFNIDFLKDLGSSLFLYFKEKNINTPKVLIGHDSRLSSPVLAKKLSEELLGLGMSTCNIELAPSPLCYFLLHHYNVDSTVVVTASHNPIEHNGFKIMFHKKYNEFDPIQKIKSFISKNITERKNKAFGFSVDPLKPYLNSLKKEFSLPPCSFVVDAGNGASGPLAKKVFSELGFSPHFIFCEPDGNFPNHHPDPSTEHNLKHLSKRVLETKSSFGVAFDGDGDRLTLVNSEGKMLLGDEFGGLFLNSLINLSKRPIVGDVKCSDYFFKTIENLNGKALKAPSGNRKIRELLLKKQAQFAVDFSGHIFFNDREDRGYDDGLYAALRFIELVSKNKNFNWDKETFKRRLCGTGEVRRLMPQEKASKALDKAKSYLDEKKEAYDSLDGLRVSRKNSWFLFRQSKTESALTYRLEASTEAELQALEKEFSEVLGCKI